MATPPATAPINVVALGVYRSVALQLEGPFASRPYRLAAVLSLRDLPESSRYTPAHLDVVLHTMNPPPQVFITGAAIPSDMTARSIEVFEQYLVTAKVDKALVIDLCHEPPVDNDWMKTILQRLESKYGA